MYKYIFSILCVCLIGVMEPSKAQISVNSSGYTTMEGRAAIGTTLSSSYRLRVISGSEPTAIFGRSASTGASRYGLRGEASGGYDNFGIYGTASGGYANAVYGVASGSSTYSRGVYASASGGSNSNYGIYATASGTGDLAGYFNGDVLVSGNIVPSDERLKTEIGALQSEQVLTDLLKLKPKRYQYLSEEELRDKNLPALRTRKGEHFGLLAQELELVFPELVTEVQHVLGEETGEIGEDPQIVTTKAINYTELTVLLLAAVQELQAELEALKAKLNE